MAKVVLAYSGGLDTSVILKWLSLRGYEVIAYVADVGQQEDFDAVQEKALQSGAKKVCIENLQTEFVVDYLFPALQGNAAYEHRYLLGTALARPLIAARQVELARTEEAQYLAHGATGKGNDQIRFELSYAALGPELEVIAPWRDPEFLSEFTGRSDMLDFAQKHGIPVEATHRKPYSEDANLSHISHEAGILEDPGIACPEEVYSLTRSPEQAPDTPSRFEIEFVHGIPTQVTNRTDGTQVSEPVHMISYLNNVAGLNGVGRLDMVENRFVGIKSRGVYEAPGMMVLQAAHRDLEGLTLDREVMHLKESLEPRFAQIIYNGFWFSPEMEFLQAAIRQSQKYVNGTVVVKVYKGMVYPESRRSEWALYDEKIASMDGAGGYDSADAGGLIRMQALRLRMYYRRGAKP